MTRLKHISLRLLTAMLLLLAFSACVKEIQTRSYTFNATMEQPSGDAKVRLVDEHWIYWEYDDMISISSNAQTNNEVAEAWLNGYGGDFSEYNGVFNTTLNEGSRYFLGLFPYSTNNVIHPHASDSREFDLIQIDVPAVQPYRNDNTFGRNVIPMVAWYGGTWASDPHTPFNLDFHSLAGLARIQVFNKTGDYQTIRTIKFTSTTDQLSGLMTVKNYKQYNPYLEPIGPLDDDKKTVTINIAEDELTLAHDDLRSFYLVLPALVKGMDTVHNYTLTMTLTTWQGNVFTTTLTVPIRRNGITYTRAIGITEWKAAPNNSTATLGLVGNGTEVRPFKIYSRAELLYMRNCFNNPRSDGFVYINGQKVTENTYFRIMRSDITLRSDNWTSGIQNFTGRLSYYGNSASPDRGAHGITNLSNVPLFESIAADGRVEGLTVKCDSVVRNIDEQYFSPFCHINNGIITDCKVTTTGDNRVTFYGRTFGNSALAGICGENNSTGTIEGCVCTIKATIATDHTHFAGICAENKGTVRGCVTASAMSLSGADNAGGIVYLNQGTTEDCYFAAVHNSGDTTEWGGIVYSNDASKTVQRCYVSHSAQIYSSHAVGGIACVNKGTVDRCWVEGNLGSPYVGGIVDSIAGGKVINCFVNDSLINITISTVAEAHRGGGIAGVLSGDGRIENCFVVVNRMVVANTDNSATQGGIVARMTGGTVDHCYTTQVHNSYKNFYGVKTGGTLNACYLLDATQTGVTRVDHSVANNATLKTNLNTSRPAGGVEWILPAEPGANTLPRFNTIVVSAPTTK